MTISMNEKRVNQGVTNCMEIMKLLNKAQLISKKLHELECDESYLEKFDKSIFELSLTPVDIIGDSVYLDYLKKNKIKTIAEPHQTGWYQVTERSKTP
jgi:hypothetical protein